MFSDAPVITNITDDAMLIHSRRGIPAGTGSGLGVGFGFGVGFGLGIFIGLGMRFRLFRLVSSISSSTRGEVWTDTISFMVIFKVS